MIDPRPPIEQAERAMPRRPPPPGVAKIADAVEDNLEHMLDSAIECILSEVPGYKASGTEVAGDTRRAAAYVYASFIDMLRTGRPPNEAIARSLGTVGADRAAQGISLGDLLQAFRVSARSAAETIDQVVRENDLDRDAAMWALESVVSWIDLISNLAARDYSRAQARLIQESEERRQGFLVDLLYGGVVGRQALERAERVGWDPTANYWVGAFGSPDGSEPSRKVDNRLADTFDLSFAVRAHGDLAILLPLHADWNVAAVETAALSVAKDLGLHVGFTEPGSGIEGVRRAYLEADEALAIARALGETVVRHGDAVLDRILRRDPELLAELVEQTVEPIVSYDRSRRTELLVTLETYLDENTSPTRTAHALHTHPQTVRYRLSRIEDITGLRMDSAAGRLRLLLGLRARRLLAALPEPDTLGPR